MEHTTEKSKLISEFFASLNSFTLYDIYAYKHLKFISNIKLQCFERFFLLQKYCNIDPY